ncbi:hypothetical protein ACIQ9P_31990 [Kitasatospora sp. NPDC094019]|uniref:hypothetical protein n=1 Tax=Kitasatospora sp. NPDC094019 TaxID=3364091 RepID=UPI00380DC7F6
MEKVIEDPLFRRVVVSVDPLRGVVGVSAPALPPATVERLADHATDPSPVGTRNGHEVLLTVDGEKGTVTPGTGFAPRRSYRVKAGLAGTSYMLLPLSEHSSRFERDGAELGLFRRDQTGQIEVRWTTRVPPSPREAALGHALAAAWGIGAPGTFKSVIGHGGAPL